jgi:hypothetical protein
MFESWRGDLPAFFVGTTHEILPKLGFAWLDSLTILSRKFSA